MRYDLEIQPELFEYEAQPGEWEAGVGEWESELGDREAAFGELESGFGELEGFSAEAPFAFEEEQSGLTGMRWVQDALNRVLGLQLTVDGVVGPATRSAIRTFQQRQGLAVDGVVGPADRRPRSGPHSRVAAAVAPRTMPATAWPFPRCSTVSNSIGIGPVPIMRS